MCLVRALERLGGIALPQEEPDIGAAFLKFSVVTKELSALMKTLMQNISNIIMFPVDTMLKTELRGVRGEMKRQFDKASKDFDSKFLKIEKEKKAQAKEAGFYRSEIDATTIAEEMEKERKMFQLQTCEYLLKYKDIKTKTGIELLQHLIEYYHSLNIYFQDGLKTIAHFGSYIDDLSGKLHTIKHKHEEERKNLLELRTLLRNTPDFERFENITNDKGGGYSLHQLQGDKHHGVTRSGHLLKKSEGKVRRVWQKRKCCVTSDGFLDICHADESKPPTRVNLLTCQIKPVPDEKRSFDLISYNRPYHFQAEDEADLKAWLSVLVNCKEKALTKAFQHASPQMNPSLAELQKTVIRYVQNLPGNDQCCDCGSREDVTWISLNFGILVCIQCSGVHRDLGVHISRIQSLTLDNLTTANLLIARAMGNNMFNDVMEATLGTGKLTSDSSMERRYDFIRAKYVGKRFVMRTCADDNDLRIDLEQAILNADLSQLLQVWAEGADLTCVLPSSSTSETALHLAVLREMGSTLHIVDFLIQNMPPKGLNRVTCDSQNMHLSGKNTALHLCALHDRRECMKLLLRSGVDFQSKNSQNKTPLDIAKEMGHSSCQDLIECAIRMEKSAFDHINTDWNLPNDDGSTDFSDDDTVIDERKSRSRPPSYAGGESPILRSRSSTCDSIRSGSSPNANCPSNHRQFSLGATISSPYNQSAGTSPKQHLPLNPYISGASSPSSTSSGSRMVATGQTARKSTSAAPPPTSANQSSVYGTLPHAPRHSQNFDANEIRTNTSKSSQAEIYNTLPHLRSSMYQCENKSYEKFDPILINKQHNDNIIVGGGGQHGLSGTGMPMTTFGHKRSPSGESINRNLYLAGAKLVLPPSVEIPNLKHVDKSSLSRPKMPPPGPPPKEVETNGQSNESVSSPEGPTAPPRKIFNQSLYGANQLNNSNESNTSYTDIGEPKKDLLFTNYTTLRRCRALYDCDADNDDELEFKEGEVLIVLNERTDDENWMEGVIEGDHSRRGMFPVSFVHMLPD
ncbi:ASAP1 family protein [Megaselia abdita]